MTKIDSTLEEWKALHKAEDELSIMRHNFMAKENFLEWILEKLLLVAEQSRTLHLLENGYCPNDHMLRCIPILVAIAINGTVPNLLSARRVLAAHAHNPPLRYAMEEQAAAHFQTTDEYTCRRTAELLWATQSYRLLGILMKRCKAAATPDFEQIHDDFAAILKDACWAWR